MRENPSNASEDVYFSHNEVHERNISVKEQNLEPSIGML